MDKANENMTETNGHLTQCAKANPRCAYTEDVTNICDNHELLLTFWDGSLSEVQRLVPPEQCFILAKQFVGFAVDVMRNMGFSVTPKVQQMGDLEELIEYWIEQYYQTGFKYYIKYQHMAEEHKKGSGKSYKRKISMNWGLFKQKKQ